MKKCSLYAAIALCAFASVVSAQTARQLTETTACGIQQALLKSPGRYIIAVVEHPGKFECGETGCTETLTIKKLLASRTASGRRYGDTIFDIEASRDALRPPRGLRSFVVATPVRESSLYYLPITQSPIDDQDVRAKEAAVKLAFGPPIGTLCKKTLPANFRILKSKN